MRAVNPASSAAPSAASNMLESCLIFPVLKLWCWTLLLLGVAFRSDKLLGKANSLIDG